MLPSKTAIQIKRNILFQIKNMPDLLCKKAASAESITEISSLWLKEIERRIERSQIMIWDTDIWNAAVRKANEVFPEVNIDKKSMTFMYEDNLWLFSGAHIKDFDFDLDTENKTGYVLAILVSLIEQGLRIIFFVLPKEKENPDLVRIREYKTIKFDQPCDIVSASICAASYFLDLKITNLEEISPHNKKQKRRLEKKGPIPKILLITLRKNEYKTNETHLSVNWRCQWLVSGHWRKQWYPSIQKHQPIYIHPFIKGPDDKPIIPLRERVHRVIK